MVLSQRSSVRAQALLAHISHWLETVLEWILIESPSVPAADRATVQVIVQIILLVLTANALCLIMSLVWDWGLALLAQALLAVVTLPAALYLLRSPRFRVGARLLATFNIGLQFVRLRILPPTGGGFFTPCALLLAGIVQNLMATSLLLPWKETLAWMALSVSQVFLVMHSDTVGAADRQSVPQFLLALFIVLCTMCGLYLLLHKERVIVQTQRETVEQARERAVLLTRAKQQFIAAMSHEVRTPLNGLLGLTFTLLETPPDLTPLQRELVENIQTCSNMILSLATRSLEYQQDARDTAPAAPENFAVRNVIDDAAAVVAVTASEHPCPIRIICSASPAVPAYLRGDLGTFQQLLARMLFYALERVRDTNAPGCIVLRIELVNERSAFSNEPDPTDEHVRRNLALDDGPETRGHLSVRSLFDRVYRRRKSSTGGSSSGDTAPPSRRGSGTGSGDGPVDAGAGIGGAGASATATVATSAATGAAAAVATAAAASSSSSSAAAAGAAAAGSAGAVATVGGTATATSSRRNSGTGAAAAHAAGRHHKHTKGSLSLTGLVRALCRLKRMARKSTSARRTEVSAGPGLAASRSGSGSTASFESSGSGSGSAGESTADDTDGGGDGDAGAAAGTAMSGSSQQVSLRICVQDTGERLTVEQLAQAGEPLVASSLRGGSSMLTAGTTFTFASAGALARRLGGSLTQFNLSAAACQPARDSGQDVYVAQLRGLVCLQPGQAPPATPPPSRPVTPDLPLASAAPGASQLTKRSSVSHLAALAGNAPDSPSLGSPGGRVVPLGGSPLRRRAGMDSVGSQMHLLRVRNSSTDEMQTRLRTGPGSFNFTAPSPTWSVGSGTGAEAGAAPPLPQVVVASDNPFSVRALSDTLRSSGCTVLEEISLPRSGIGSLSVLASASASMSVTPFGSAASQPAEPESPWVGSGHLHIGPDVAADGADGDMYGSLADSAMTHARAIIATLRVTRAHREPESGSAPRGAAPPLVAVLDVPNTATLTVLLIDLRDIFYDVLGVPALVLLVPSLEVSAVERMLQERTAAGRVLVRVLAAPPRSAHLLAAVKSAGTPSLSPADQLAQSSATRPLSAVQPMPQPPTPRLASIPLNPLMHRLGPAFAFGPGRPHSAPLDAAAAALLSPSLTITVSDAASDGEAHVPALSMTPPPTRPIPMEALRSSRSPPRPPPVSAVTAAPASAPAATAAPSLQAGRGPDYGPSGLEGGLVEEPVRAEPFPPPPPPRSPSPTAQPSHGPMPPSPLAIPSQTPVLGAGTALRHTSGTTAADAAACGADGARTAVGSGVSAVPAPSAAPVPGSAAAPPLPIPTRPSDGGHIEVAVPGAPGSGPQGSATLRSAYAHRPFNSAGSQRTDISEQSAGAPSSVCSGSAASDDTGDAMYSSVLLMRTQMHVPAGSSGSAPTAAAVACPLGPPPSAQLPTLVVPGLSDSGNESRRGSVSSPDSWRQGADSATGASPSAFRPGGGHGSGASRVPAVLGSLSPPPVSPLTMPSAAPTEVQAFRLGVQASAPVSGTAGPLTAAPPLDARELPASRTVTRPSLAGSQVVSIDELTSLLSAPERSATPHSPSSVSSRAPMPPSLEVEVQPPAPPTDLPPDRVRDDPLTAAASDTVRRPLVAAAGTTPVPSVRRSMRVWVLPGDSAGTSSTSASSGSADSQAFITSALRSAASLRGAHGSEPGSSDAAPSPTAGTPQPGELDDVAAPDGQRPVAPSTPSSRSTPPVAPTTPASAVSSMSAPQPFVANDDTAAAAALAALTRRGSTPVTGGSSPGLGRPPTMRQSRSDLTTLFQASKNARASVKPPSSGPFAGRLVLVVDDNALNTKVLVRQLEQFGAVCETAENGQRALDMMLGAMERTMLLPGNVESGSAPRTTLLSPMGSAVHPMSPPPVAPETPPTIPPLPLLPGSRTPSGSSVGPAAQPPTQPPHSYLAGRRKSLASGDSGGGPPLSQPPTPIAGARPSLASSGSADSSEHTPSPSSVSSSVATAPTAAAAVVAAAFAAATGAGSPHGTGSSGAPSPVPPSAPPSATGRPYDLVLMDLHMPVLDGLQATKQWRQLEQEHGWRRTPIVAVTASTERKVEEECIQVGMDDFVAKPVLPDKVEKVLQRVLGRDRSGW